MQKFTRALTREIEVGGERLAVTFDEAGMAIRPVGSRKPPRRLSWPAFCCLIAGDPAEPPDEEVRRALATLLGGPAPALRPLTAGPTAAASTADLLQRLGGWLARSRKRYLAGLRSGATGSQLRDLEAAAGGNLHPDLAAWLAWHNGEGEEFGGAFVESFHLMSVDEIIRTLQERRTEKGWDASYLPLLDDYQEDLIVVDTSKPDLPVREIWRGREDHPEVATSFRGWLAALLADFEAGRYHEDPERGDFLRATT